MLKQHSQFLTFIMAVGDLVVIACACVCAYVIGGYFFSRAELPSAASLLPELLLVELVSLIALYGAGLYKPRRDKSFLLELGQILKASCAIWGALVVLIYYTAPATVTVRPMLTVFLPMCMGALILERGAFRSAQRFVRRRGWNLRHALIVGTGRLAQSTALTLHRNSWTGIRVAGFVAADLSSDEPAQNQFHLFGEPTVQGIPVVGHVDSLPAIVERMRVDSVFVAISTEQNDLLRRIIGQLERTAVDVRIIPDLFLSRFPQQVGITELDGLPILSLRENPLEGWPAIYKRVFDVCGACFGIVLLSLPMVLMAAAIKLCDGGPIFYMQDRMSFGRRTFKMIKFRTMVTDAELSGPLFAEKGDPRCTRLGRWMRSMSLDELPQLFNVVRGDMSLVGPRPERPEMLGKIQEEVPGFPMRLQVRGGITGWAQVNGYRGRTSFRKRLQYDLYYLNHWSPLLDLRIVATTIFRGFRNPNAY